MTTHVFQNRMRGFRQSFEQARNGHLLRDGLLMLAGAEALHTLAHVWLGVSGLLPRSDPWFPSLTMTPELNGFAILANALVTVGLLYWANRLRR
jgi:hypothetical protein